LGASANQTIFRRPTTRTLVTQAAFRQRRYHDAQRRRQASCPPPRGGGWGPLQFEEYGKAVFTGKVADEYLAKHGAKGEILKDPTWVKNHADTVAKAVFEW
jgi:hypothetical protein